MEYDNKCSFKAPDNVKYASSHNISMKDMLSDILQIR